MNDAFNLTITEVENYLKRIFTKESLVLAKEFKIMMLEFEIALEKSVLERMKIIHKGD